MLFALLPAYNESAALPLLLTAYSDLRIPEPLRVVLVDDGSSDDTIQVARNASAGLDLHIIEHKVNKGLGAAFLTGFTYVAQVGKADDLVVTMDADNTHSPEYIIPMLEVIQRADVVIASRYASGGKETGVPAFRSFLSRGASILYRFFVGVPGVQDYTCGYRMYRVGVIQKAFQRYGDDFIQEKGFSSTGEILIKLSPLAKAIGEVPFDLRYDLKGGQSKMPKMKTVFKTLQLINRFRGIAKQVRSRD